MNGHHSQSITDGGHMTLTSRTASRPATLTCSDCNGPIGPADVLLRIFDRGRLLPVCTSCAPRGLDYSDPAKCDGCGREVRYERSEHHRIYSTCNQKCRLIGFSRRRLEAAARARRKNCAQCGVAFAAMRRDARYCTSNCRKQAHRERQAERSSLSYLGPERAGQETVGKTRCQKRFNKL